MGAPPITERPNKLCPCIKLTSILSPHASHVKLKKFIFCILCKVLSCKGLYFNLKQGKDIIAQVICVRGMKHARQGSAKRSEAPKRSAVRNAPTLALARGTPKKIKLFHSQSELKN
ncbi:MAG: hypothetical protein NZ519_03385 [Bacteroidia bacterium]|nr:hypothetical protein [Bacteroidia bacterium]